jgi:hypothetical protein
MTKFYALIAACAVFAPMAFATLNQAAQIVAWSASSHLNFESSPMTKFYALIAACAVFAPMAMATLKQAAQIVA